MKAARFERLIHGGRSEVGQRRRGQNGSRGTWRMPPLAVLSGAADAITDVAVSKDATLVAASSADKSAHVWKLPAAAAAQPIPAEAALVHDTPLRSIDFGGDASRLAAAGDDGVVQVWDVATRTRLQRYLPRGGAITQVALADDNVTLLSTCVDQTAAVDTVAASLVFGADPQAVTDAVFTPDGAAIVSVGSELAVKQWDLTGKLGRQLAGAKAAFGRVAVRGDGAQIAAADVDGRLYLWNAADAALTATIETGAAVTELGYSPKHEQIVAAGADQQLRVFATADGAMLQTLASATPLTTVAFTADGRQMLTNASAGEAQHGFAEWAFASPAELGAWAGHTGAVYALAFSPDGMWAASAGADQTVRIWNVETGQVAKQLSGHAAAVYGLAFQADSKQLVSASADGSARLWNVDSGAEVRQFVVPVAPADETESPKPVAPCLAVATQGNLIATANSDGGVYLWNAANGQLAKTLEALDGAVYRVAFNADATKLLAVGHTGRMVIGNIADGKTLLDTSAPAVAYDGRLTTDGSRLAIAGADGNVHLLDVPAAAR
ncbi:MAG: WD40 repeat domain-containing protein [Pirellulaceae bacterium]